MIQVLTKRSRAGSGRGITWWWGKGWGKSPSDIFPIKEFIF
jgi:hypothetical protein